LSFQTKIKASPSPSKGGETVNKKQTPFIMLRPKCEIYIKSKATRKVLLFDYCVEIEIESTWKRMTDTCKITIPRELQLHGTKIKDAIKAGDEVRVFMWYDGYDKKEEFRGYVRDVQPNVPLVINCEDAMWLLKQRPSIQKGKINAWKSTSLGEVVRRLVGNDFQLNTNNIQMGAYRLTERTVAAELQKLGERTGQKVYFRHGVLNVGFAYPISWAGDVTKKGFYHVQKNIPRDGFDLTWRNKEDALLKLEGVITMPDGKQKKLNYGDSEGETHTFHEYNISEAVMKERLKDALERMKVSGYKGTLATMGLPYIEHGYTADIQDDFFKERNGSYFIDKVQTTFGTNGFKRKVTVGAKT
jgi:hypothetical protein